MRDSEEMNKAGSKDERSAASKKRYEAPQVRFERVFETMALSCGKVQATQGSCRFNRKAS